MENKETSIQWLMSQAVNWARNTNSGNDIVEFPKGAINQAKEMEKEQAQNYAEFCVMCDRENLPLLDFESYISTYGGNK
jgi:chloramphenicol O-acetyltransferase